MFKVQRGRCGAVAVVFLLLGDSMGASRIPHRKEGSRGLHIGRALIFQGILLVVPECKTRNKRLPKTSLRLPQVACALPKWGPYTLNPEP